MVNCIKKMMESSGGDRGGGWWSFVWSILLESCTVR